jgi:hypothetical protein
MLAALYTPAVALDGQPFEARRHPLGVYDAVAAGRVWTVTAGIAHEAAEATDDAAALTRDLCSFVPRGGTGVPGRRTAHVTVCRLALAQPITTPRGWSVHQGLPTMEHGRARAVRS